MNKIYRRNIIRTITKSLNRYIAILAIVALGVGFFAGLKVTKPSMVKTGNDYMREHSMYDYKLMSSYGFTEDEVDEMANKQDVINAEGSYSRDFLYKSGNGDKVVLKAIIIPEKLNTVRLVDGRMPENSNECLIDAYKYGPDAIGKVIEVDEDNDEETIKSFSHKKYTVVGTVFSPLYLNNERGTTSIGSGRITAFVYIPSDGMKYEYFNEMYIKCQDSLDIYTDEYEDFLAENKDDISDELLEICNERYNLIKDIPGVQPLKTYVFDRTENMGYICFNNDSSIVESVAKVFPLFFFLIAALVCSTTMTRMVDDERNQIGTMRALGYSSFAIIMKYLIYSGSAAIIGCVGGFFAGCYVFPTVIWKCYALLYGFCDLSLYNSVPLFFICLLVSLLCSAGATYLACKNELKCMPSDLIRPKTPVAGKRILLERLGFIWKHMKFLHKVTARNVFRFKKRMFMMLIGIAGCTALVLTGLGIGDSISNIAEFQYDEIDVHDIEITFASDITNEEKLSIEDVCGNAFDSIGEMYKTTVNYMAEDAIKSVYLIAGEEAVVNDYESFNMLDNKGKFPKTGEVMLSSKIANIAGVKTGDDISFSYGDNKSVTLKVSGIFENYVWHYAYITPETYEKFFGEAYNPNTIYLNVKAGSDVYEIGADVGDIQGVINVLVIKQLRDRVSDMMGVMNSVVWLVIGCAAALAFIVLFNLSNINITERVREIATIKVLGFYPGETGAYVFRENLVLTILGIIIGVPLGIALHGFVMSQIQVDMIAFKVVILPKSYILGVITVLLFLVIVDLVMRRKIDRIDMAESLKSVE